MNAVVEAALRQAIEGYIDPLLGQDLVSLGALHALHFEDGQWWADVGLAFAAEQFRHGLADDVQAWVLAQTGHTLHVRVAWQVTAQGVQPNLKPLASIKNIIAVASGKGGVGKSTVAVNVALALQAEGARVGMLDADIYGPSQPRLLGTKATPTSPDGKHMHPIEAHGLQVMSIGFLINEAEPMIWRGPMVTQALMQLFQETLWQDLDYLVIDLPPGTGDVQLSLSQRIPVSGAIIVTTPQDLALIDAQKGLAMFEKVSVPVLGVVENMALFCCPNCGHESRIFGEGGGAQLSQQFGVTLLGSVPLEAEIRRLSDAGQPLVVSQPDAPASLIYQHIARQAMVKLAYGAVEGLPELSMS
jgi:ATP-binding protein involved in chromosome partitioning